MKKASGRRKFLKLMGGSAAASVATVVPVHTTQAQENTPQQETQVEHAPAVVIHNLCVRCEVEVARFPKREPRLCATCRTWRYKEAAKEGFTDPSPRARASYGLPQRDGTYVFDGKPYKPHLERDEKSPCSRWCRHDPF